MAVALMEAPTRLSSPATAQHVEDELRLSEDCFSDDLSPPPIRIGPEHECGHKLRISVAANQGGRKYMEDRVHVEVVRSAYDSSIEYTYVAVYDGHGGSEASEYCRQHLLKNIQMQEGFNSDDDNEFLTAIREGFLETHSRMRKVVGSWARTPSGYESTAGTTASCAFIRRGKVYTGHVGDSAIILVPRSGPAWNCRLTVDHKPDNILERTRIEECGGQVKQKALVHRVVWTRPLKGHVGPVRRSTPTESIPFLAVARSLGDFWSFCESTGKFVVSPDPDVSVISLTDADACLVLASDGLTNVLQGEQVVELVQSLEKNFNDPQAYRHRTVHPNHARHILRRTLQKWNRYRADNISVVSVYLDRYGWEEAEESVEDKMADGLSLEDALSMFPDGMFSVTSEREAVLRLCTAHVPLIYNGVFDANYKCVDFIGPGFMSLEDEARRDSERANEKRDDGSGILEEDNELNLSPENFPPSLLKRSLFTIPAQNDKERNGEDAPTMCQYVNTSVEVSTGSGMEEEKDEVEVFLDESMVLPEGKVSSLDSADPVEQSVRTPEKTSAVAVLRISRSATRRSRLSWEESLNGEDVHPADPAPSACSLSPTSSASTPLILAQLPLSSVSPIVNIKVCDEESGTEAEAPRPTRSARRAAVRLINADSAQPRATRRSTRRSTRRHSSMDEGVDGALSSPRPSVSRKTANGSSSAATSPTLSVLSSSSPPPSVISSASRKRVHSPTMTTPLMDRMFLESPVLSLDDEEGSDGEEWSRPLTCLSEPCTPTRPSCGVVSRWSLSDQLGHGTAEGEPAAKRSRIWGFFRRIVFGNGE